MICMVVEGVRSRHGGQDRHLGLGLSMLAGRRAASRPPPAVFDKHAVAGVSFPTKRSIARSR